MTMSHVLEMLFRLARCRPAASACRYGAASIGLGSSRHVVSRSRRSPKADRGNAPFDAFLRTDCAAVRVDRLESIWGERIEPLAIIASAGNERLPEPGRSRDAR